MLGGVAGAQTVDTRCIQCKIEWDGSAESCWKTQSPSTADDAFSVDLDNRCAGLTVVAICAEFCDTDPGGGPNPGFLSLCPDNLVVDPTGTTPDKGNPCTTVINPTGQPGGTHLHSPSSPRKRGSMDVIPAKAGIQGCAPARRKGPGFPPSRE